MESPTAPEIPQVGNVETIMSGEARVRTEESSLGTVVERRRIEQLPMNGRHVFNLVKLVAGVQPVDRNMDGFGEITNQGFSQIQFNGGPVYGTQMFLDGGANTVPVHNEISVVPMVDAVEEFKVETNGLKASLVILRRRELVRSRARTIARLALRVLPMILTPQRLRHRSPPKRRINRFIATTRAALRTVSIQRWQIRPSLRRLRQCGPAIPIRRATVPTPERA